MEVRLVEVRLEEVGLEEVCLVEVCMEKVGLVEVCLVEVCMENVCLEDWFGELFERFVCLCGPQCGPGPRKKPTYIFKVGSKIVFITFYFPVHHDLTSDQGP